MWSQATVTIFNWQQYRHISTPGWILGWEWTKKEVIWKMVGAEATTQGDCSAYHSDPIPHCCALNPTVVDLLPGVPYNQQVSNCCKGGVISSFAQDPQTALSAFQITVGNAGTSNTTVKLPVNFTLRTPGPGYSCGPATKVPASQFPSTDNRRVTQAFSKYTFIGITCFALMAKILFCSDIRVSGHCLRLALQIVRVAMSDPFQWLMLYVQTICIELFSSRLGILLLFFLI